MPTAFPERQVFSLPGEGEIAMLMGNTITLKQAMLPAKVVIVNNGTLGSVDWR